MTDQPVHGCTIDGQPAMPILASEHTRLIARAAEAEAALARVHRAADLIEAGAPWTASHADTARRLRDAATISPAEQTDGHAYLSTGCLHGEHGYCQSMTGLNGAKRPGECKHCGARCICGCHLAAALPSGQGPPRMAHSGPDSAGTGEAAVEALSGPQTGADGSDGPSVEECAAADRVWPLQRAGE